MAIIGIVHAVSSEDKSKYGAVGDQLQVAIPDIKGEIRRANWYNRSGGWGIYLDCTDAALAKDAAKWAERIADSPDYGYSQGSGTTGGRWSGFKAIKSQGFEGGKGNFDCSSLVISCYVLAGCPKLSAAGYTGSMRKLLLATGKFIENSDTEHLTSSNLATLGGIYIAPKAHTIIVVDAPAYSGADAMVDTPYVLVKGNVNVRIIAAVSGKVIYIARAGDKLPYLGKTEVDANGNMWHFVGSTKGPGYISAFTGSKKKYTELIS